MKGKNDEAFLCPDGDNYCNTTREAPNVAGQCVVIKKPSCLCTTDDDCDYRVEKHLECLKWHCFSVPNDEVIIFNLRSE